MMTPSTEQLSQLLTTLTTTNPPESITRASNSLTKHLQPSCVPQLTAILFTHHQASTRALAAHLLRTHQHTHLTALPPTQTAHLAQNLLSRLLEEPAPDTRRALIQLHDALPCPPSRELRAVAAALLASPDPLRRAHALLLPDPPLEAITTALRDPAPHVRQAALTAFASASSRPAENLLTCLPLALRHISALQHDHPLYPPANAALFEALANLLPIHTPDHLRDSFTYAVDTLHTAPLPAAAPALEFLLYALETTRPSLVTPHLLNHATRSACRILIHEQHHQYAPETRTFFAMRLLDALATKPRLATPVFAHANTFINHPDTGSKAVARILSSLAEGCHLQYTTHAQALVTKALQHDPRDQHAVTASIDAITAITTVLDIDQLPDQTAATIANSCIKALTAALTHPSTPVQKSACVALQPVLSLFPSAHLDPPARRVARALEHVNPDAAVEAVIAVSVLAEHASHNLVNTPSFQSLLSNTVLRMLSTTSHDPLNTAAALEAAASLVSVCTTPHLVTNLAQHALQRLANDDDDEDDPTVKQGALSFFANLVDSTPADPLFQYAQPVLSCAIHSVVKKDVFVITDDDGSVRDVHRDDLNQDTPTVQVRTAYLDEKMVALGCMGAFATALATDQCIHKLSSLQHSAATPLFTLFTTCSELADEMTTHFHSDIRMSAYRASCRLANANLHLHAANPAFAFVSPAYTHRVLTTVLEGLVHDHDLSVVTDLLNTFSIFLAQVPPDTIVEMKSDITEALTLLIAGRAPCQTSEEDDDFPKVDTDEIDSLIEAVGDVVEALVRALRGHFAQHFLGILEQILKGSCGPSHSGGRSSRGMVLGTVSGVLLFMCWERCPFPPPNVNDATHERALSACDDLAAVALPLALDAIRSGDSRTLQRNAVFLLGVIFQRVRTQKTQVWMRFSDALETLQQILVVGKTGNGALVDNAAGAIARILTAKGMPADASCNRQTMLQAALSCVPMQDDPVENTTLARAILHAANERSDELMRDARVLSCLVTAVLVHVETRNKGKSRWAVSGIDPNDEMVGLDAEEYARIVKMLKQIREVAGEGLFMSLRLSEQDASVLARVMSG